MEQQIAKQVIAVAMTGCRIKKTHKKIQNDGKRQPYFIITVMLETQPRNIFIDGGSRNSTFQQNSFKNVSRIQRLETEYRDVNARRNNFRGEILVKNTGINQLYERICNYCFSR